MKQTEPEWYTTWFDTPFYHILYKDRDDNEAQKFMSKLTSHLSLKSNAHILDVACGRGRHAVYLNKLGYKVTGIDLSPNNINYAKQFENERLYFKEHDMCKPMPLPFDAVFNLFTSFGYFEKDQDNINAIKAMSKNLKTNGVGVIDFLNIHKTLKNIKAFETKQIDGINFNLRKWVEKGHLFKEIAFEFEGEEHEYVEKLMCLDLETFEKYFDSTNLKIKAIYGDYQLNPYNFEDSDRLILTFTHQ